MIEALGIRGAVVIEKRRAGVLLERTERVYNAFVGQENAVKVLCGIAGGEALDSGAVLQVLDTVDAVLIASQTVDGTFPTNVAGVATFKWTVPAGSATGAWDDILIWTLGSIAMSQFLGNSATWGSKGAGDEWVVSYTLTVS